MKTYRNEKGVLGQTFGIYRGMSKLRKVGRFSVCVLKLSEC